MEKNVRLQKQRGFLLLLPVLVLPFITMAFWSLGGGQGQSDDKVVQKRNGLNLSLPSANLKNGNKEDKMSFYDKAQHDEQLAADAIKNDPYYQLPNQAAAPSDTNELVNIMAKYPSKYSQGLNASPIHPSGYKDQNEEKVMERLNRLQKEIDKPSPMLPVQESSYQNNESSISSDVTRLEEMMNLMKNRQQDDPEMQQLEGMLNKVMDIQHPERVRERMKENSLQQKKKVFTVSRSVSDARVSLFGRKDTIDKKVRQAGFYTAANPPVTENVQNAIAAVVHETQTLVNGSIVKLRLLNDIYIAGTFIPKDNFIFGMASLEGERLQIEITSIRYEQSVYPTELSVHDIDGLAGIYVPGSITRDVAKQSIDNSMQGLEMATVSPSVGVQAATAGISAAKSLLGKKVRLVKVTVKAGYMVLLWDKSNQE
jgi:conjugative transposon TraM protein